MAMKAWAFTMSRPWAYNLAFRIPALFQGPMLKDGKFDELPFAFRGWTENRDFPAIAKKSFRAMWRDHHAGARNHKP
jgi:L-lactate dehydrogenase complex protein LldF